jgi:hypothetical protein
MGEALNEGDILTPACLEMNSEEAMQVVICSVSTMQVETGILIGNGGERQMPLLNVRCLKHGRRSDKPRKNFVTAAAKLSLWPSRLFVSDPGWGETVD